MNIWTPKFKIIQPKKEIALPIGMSGRYKLRALAPNGINVRRESRWFDNLILDAGLNRIGSSSDNHSTCVVGTGSTAPTNSDTALASLLASTTDIDSAVNASGSSSPYFARKTWTYRFGQGDAQGNLTEVGVGWGTTTLFSRALIEDDAGDPTTFVVQSDEFLDVVYQLTCNVPLTDVEDTITISSTSHDIVIRAAEATAWALNGGASEALSFQGGGATLVDDHFVYDGDIGLITAGPSGTATGQSSTSNVAYVPDSFQLDYAITYGLNNANIVSGIKSVETHMARGGNMPFQCSYDPVIDKDNTQILTLNFRHAWARVDTS